MKKIKISFIGAGNIIEQHLRVFKSFNNVELTGIHSRTKAKAKKLALKYGIKYISGSIKELYSQSNSDIVVIGVSIQNTKNVCVKASKYPWKCLVEKPIGVNLKEAINLRKKIKYKKSFYVALNRNHFSSTNKLMNLLSLDNSARLIQIWDQQKTTGIDKDYPKKVIKNFMYANSIHLVDYIRTLARGKIKSIRKLFKHKKKDINFISKIIYFTSGDIVIFNSIWNRPGPWEINVSTDRYFIELNPLEELRYRDNLGKKKFFYFKKQNVDVKYKPGFYNQAKEILKEVRNLSNKSVSFDDVIKTKKLINKIF